MGEELIKALLDRPIAYNRAYARIADSATAGLLLSQAAYWARTMNDAWFYKTAAQWLEETGLSRHEFQEARRLLVTLGFLEYELRSMPAKGHYRVNWEAICASLQTLCKQDCTPSANKIADPLQTGLQKAGKQPDIRTETTTKTTRERAPTSGAAPGTPAGRKRRHPIPEDFAVTERVRQWALKQQILPSYVQECFETFVSHAKADTVLHTDWDEALMGWIRKERKLYPNRPWRAEPHSTTDTQCKWTNLGTETRCTAAGDIHMGNGAYLCSKHYVAHADRVAAERKRGATTTAEATA